MKVGIVTFFSAYNFGAFLQAYALQEEIKSLGYDVEMINYRPKCFESYRPLYWNSAQRPYNFVRCLLSIIKYFLPRIFRKHIFEKSIQKYFKVSKPISFKNASAIKEINVLVFGSDQIWSMQLLGGFDEIYWGTCFQNIKKISYAASVGQSYPEILNEPKVLKALSDFKAVGVRERQLKNVLKNTYDINSTLVLDPTLLHGSNFWSKFAGKKKKRKKPYLFLYIAAFSDQAGRIAETIAAKLNLEIVNLFPSKRYGKILESYSYSPQDFVNLIKNADFIVTTSFHATAFSIIFQKDFYIIKGREANSRVETLLSVCNLEKRYIDILNEITKVNYEGCEKKLNKARKLSRNYLKNGLYE